MPLSIVIFFPDLLYYSSLDSQDSSRYFPANKFEGLSKNFGVYTFEDNKPLFERKARLIERLAEKKTEKKNLFNDPPDTESGGALDKTKVKMRSIPGGIGH